MDTQKNMKCRVRKYILKALASQASGPQTAQACVLNHSLTSSGQNNRGNQLILYLTNNHKADNPFWFQPSFMYMYEFHISPQFASDFIKLKIRVVGQNTNWNICFAEYLLCYLNGHGLYLCRRLLNVKGSKIAVLGQRLSCARIE